MRATLVDADGGVDLWLVHLASSIEKRLTMRVREQMLLLAAQAARQTKVAMVLVTLASGTVWMPKPDSVEQARGLPNWQRWQMQMGGFIDKCRSIDGLHPVDKEVTIGSVLANLKWVFTYKPVGDDPNLQSGGQIRRPQSRYLYTVQSWQEPALTDPDEP